MKTSRVGRLHREDRVTHGAAPHVATSQGGSPAPAHRAQAGTLPEELDLLHEAQTKWRSGNAAAALSLLEQGTIGNPFILPTGPTAHVSPVIALMLAAMWPTRATKARGQDVPGVAPWLYRAQKGAESGG